MNAIRKNTNVLRAVHAHFSLDKNLLSFLRTDEQGTYGVVVDYKGSVLQLQLNNIVATVEKASFKDIEPNLVTAGSHLYFDENAAVVGIACAEVAQEKPVTVSRSTGSNQNTSNRW